MKKYDAIIIGTGQVAIPLATKFDKEGLSTAVIEKGNIGGTCVNVGCTPTKAYVASARRAFVAKNSSDLGVEAKDVHIDLLKIKKRKDKIVEESQNNVRSAFENLGKVDIYKGEASFVDANTIKFGEETIRGEKIVINVGAKPVIPEEFEQLNYLTNKSILELEQLPEHLIIIGGGYIALEFGQMFKRFGAEVTILEKNKEFLEKEDRQIAHLIRKKLEDENITIHTGCQNMKVSQQSDRTTISVEVADNQLQIKGTHLLLAVGREPNTKPLKLENADIKTDKNGYINVNDYLQTSQEHIYALGDCNGEGAFTHTAVHDSKVLIDFLFGDKKRTVSERYSCYAMFIDPPFARVGLNEEQIKEKNIEAQLASRKMNRVARATERGETDGLMKIWVEKSSKRILGASLFGITADESIHTIIDLMYAKGDYTIIRDAVHIHPTVSELIPTMLENLEDVE